MKKLKIKIGLWVVKHKMLTKEKRTLKTLEKEAAIAQRKVEKQKAKIEAIKQTFEQLKVESK